MKRDELPVALGLLEGSFLDREVEAQLKHRWRHWESSGSDGFLDRELEAQLKLCLRETRARAHQSFLDREVEAQLKRPG